MTSDEKFLIMTEVLMSEIEIEGEKETELDSTVGAITNTIKPFGDEIFSSFQGKHDSLDIPEGAKVALKTLSKFASVLTNKEFGKTEKIKNLLKVATKVAFKT